MIESTIRDDTSARHRSKYSNKNPFHKHVLGRFFDAVTAEIREMSPEKTLEFGCGEGLFLEQLKLRGLSFKDLTAIDLRDDALDYARSLHPEYSFLKEDLLAWEKAAGSFDLVISSQVLEHLPSPERFVKKMEELGSRHFIFTVPWEPFFRLMNLMRGRDIVRLGNHPEHINQWGKHSFKRLVEPYVTITKLYTVFPFIICVAEKKA